mmetsp:Transcript_14699/g.17889  ORF Transcript_14699/g.17889 Transcript_14699/m.17889 type:complete len:171 (+) Transcript_14699:28-540(+)
MESNNTKNNSQPISKQTNELSKNNKSRQKSNKQNDHGKKQHQHQHQHQQRVGGVDASHLVNFCTKTSKSTSSAVSGQNTYRRNHHKERKKPIKQNQPQRRPPSAAAAAGSLFLQSSPHHGFILTRYYHTKLNPNRIHSTYTDPNHVIQWDHIRIDVRLVLGNFLHGFRRT